MSNIIQFPHNKNSIQYMLDKPYFLEPSYISALRQAKINVEVAKMFEGSIVAYEEPKKESFWAKLVGTYMVNKSNT